MTPSDVLTRLAIADAHELLAPHWQTSANCLPDQPAILDTSTIRAERSFVGLPSRFDTALTETASRVAGSSDLSLLAWHCERILYDELEYDVTRSRAWPEVIQPLGEQTSLFYLLIALGAVRRMRSYHQNLGIPDQITRATCTHFPAAAERLRMRSGLDGVGPEALYWLRNHTTGRLYCLGRLEYMLKPFRGGLTAYRHRDTGSVVALAAEGTCFDREGLVSNQSQPGSEGSWVSTIESTGTEIFGPPISPTGYARREPVRLPLQDWQQALSPGALIYEVHIPEGGGMTIDACQDSMRQATEFFPRFFPEGQAVGFACGSWILNPELEHVYHAESNMVRWQRELYLYPIQSGDRSGLHFIFGTGDVDPATAARDTSLRRALLDRLASGGRLIGGGMFMLLEDFDRFGGQIYRSNWPGVLDQID